MVVADGVGGFSAGRGSVCVRSGAEISRRVGGKGVLAKSCTRDFVVRTRTSLADSQLAHTICRRSWRG
jgi:hypothetical protein